MKGFELDGPCFKIVILHRGKKSVEAKEKRDTYQTCIPTDQGWAEVATAPRSHYPHRLTLSPHSAAPAGADPALRQEAESQDLGGQWVPPTCGLKGSVHSPKIPHL